MDGVNTRVADILSRGWSLLLLRGLVALAFGILTWVRPGISIATLVFLFGFYALFDGILATWTAISGRHEREHWKLLLMDGLIGIVIGLLTFITPQITAFALLFYIAVWAIGRGIVEIVTAIRVRREIQGEWRLIAAGIASVGFGLLLLARPAAGALTVLWLIALYAVAMGVLLIMLAFKVRHLSGRIAHA